MLCILFSKWQFLVIFNSHPFESTGSHNLQTIFEDLIFSFVLQSHNEGCLLLYMCNMVFFGTLTNIPTLAMWTVWLSRSPSISSLPWLCCGEQPSCSHYKCTRVFLHQSHLSCHLSSYYSLNIQMKLLFHLTRSWIAWARNLEAGRLFLRSAVRRMHKWSSLQMKGPQEIYWLAFCKMVASW